MLRHQWPRLDAPVRTFFRATSRQAVGLLATGVVALQVFYAAAGWPATARLAAAGAVVVAGLTLVWCRWGGRSVPQWAGAWLAYLTETPRTAVYRPEGDPSGDPAGAGGDARPHGRGTGR